MLCEQKDHLYQQSSKREEKRNRPTQDKEPHPNAKASPVKTEEGRAAEDLLRIIGHKVTATVTLDS
jgi:hypothetical protein